jgi:hypothetical protein
MVKRKELAIQRGWFFAQKTLSLREGGPGEARDGCGAAQRSNLVPPLIRRWGGTFPQGKAGVPLSTGGDS